MGGHFVAVDTHGNCKQTRPLTYGLKGEGKECKQIMPLTYGLKGEEEGNKTRTARCKGALMQNCTTLTMDDFAKIFNRPWVAISSLSTPMETASKRGP